jgi:hypothetical protein
MCDGAPQSLSHGIVSDGLIKIASELRASLVSTDSASQLPGREQLECVSRMRGHICSSMGIIVPAVKLIELHGVPSGIAVCLHGKQQRCGCIAVGLGKRKERWPRVPDDNIRRASRFHRRRHVCLDDGQVLGHSPLLVSPPIGSPSH